MAAEAKSGLSPATKKDGRQRNVAAKMAVVPLQRSGGGMSLAPWEDYCQQGETDSCLLHHRTQPPAQEHATSWSQDQAEGSPRSRYQLQSGFFDFERHVIAFDFECQLCNADKHCPVEDLENFPNWCCLIDFNCRYSSSRKFRSSVGKPKIQNCEKHIPGVLAKSGV